MKLGGIGKAAELAVPLLTFQTSLQSAIEHTKRECDQELPEQYDVAALGRYLHERPQRRENAHLLAELWKGLATAKRKKPGKPTPQERQQKADWLSQSQNLLQAEKDADALHERLLALRKRRRSEKAPDVKEEDAAVEEGTGLATAPCSYHYTALASIRTRKQASAFAAQRMSRRLQHVVLPHTHDLDIENSLFTLLPQLLTHFKPEPSMRRWTYVLCGKDRARVCQEILSVPFARGKQLL